MNAKKTETNPYIWSYCDALFVIQFRDGSFPSGKNGVVCLHDFHYGGVWSSARFKDTATMIASDKAYLMNAPS